MLCYKRKLAILLLILSFCTLSLLCVVPKTVQAMYCCPGFWVGAVPPYATVYWGALVYAPSCDCYLYSLYDQDVDEAHEEDSSRCEEVYINPNKWNYFKVCCVQPIYDCHINW